MKLPFLIVDSETDAEVAAFMLATYVHMVADGSLFSPDDKVMAWGKHVGSVAEVAAMDFRKFLHISGIARETYYGSIDELKRRNVYA